ncbi:Cof-type HAD-IIB family hydrolase [Jeotgalibaca sp. MA1X17-3]|uniref:Cof-type HAD-IIB family hydrolase n=1 Tax=Jeotgalibaca sp. MA1X17-3 TaxID=2908211 RepID=UPI001F4475A7|nr:Cof-type HAD-IIB family hydrolase [Jeotgalibaca sp. MA1X17-3]UJF15218.1 Cof-type HAD-IIB family hydrolase [Jeotgalibaca sp. MA1X17-3]
MIKLVAIDIDGTLVNEEKIMTEKVKHAIHQAIDQGMKIVLCTGRPFEGIRPYLNELNFKDENDFVISQNGARITQNSTGEVIDEQSLRLDELQEVISYVENFSLDICVLNEEHFYVLTDDINEHLREQSRLLNMELEIVTSKHFDHDSCMLKVVCHAEKDILDDFEAQLTPEMREKYYIVRSEDFFVEIMVKNVNKGTALTTLADHLEIQMSEVAAIGDGENDYEMIEAAGLGIVMDNGTERVKGIANEITLSNVEDGVAHAFEKWILNQ